MAYIESLPYLVVESNGEKIEIENTPENLSSCICSKGYSADLSVTSPNGDLLISTSGPFVDRCSDTDYLSHTLMPVLMPMQTGSSLIPETRVYGIEETVSVAKNHSRRR